MADVLALVDDLFFQSKLMETARHVGVTLQTVTTGDALVEAVRTTPPRLVLVDLNARQGALDAIKRLRPAGRSVVGQTAGGQFSGGQSPADHLTERPSQEEAQPIIAFLSHVQPELAEQARAAGCQQVLPRSKFTAELAQILRQAKG